MENFALIMLNDNEKCTGEITWSRKQHSWVIDFVIATDKFYKKFQIFIDEKQEKFSFSDHNFIDIVVKVKDKKEYD